MTHSEVAAECLAVVLLVQVCLDHHATHFSYDIHGNVNTMLQDNKKLYEAVSEDYVHIVSKKARLDAVKKDEYMNALQVKFAYALTCHKSQGGQWKAVFLDQGYLTDEMMNKEYLRWLYTAVTRASAELYLLNTEKKSD